MKPFPRTFLFAVALLLLVCACAPKSSFDIRGEWEYTMGAVDGNTYDTGTIIFSGDPDKGTYRQTNIYQVVYKGEYAVSGTTLQLTGDETWIGTLVNANSISGTWNHSDSTSGTFTAKRK